MIDYNNRQVNQKKNKIQAWLDLNQRQSESESDTLSSELHAYSAKINFSNIPNLKELNKELFYCSGWYKDKEIFIRLISNYNYKDIDILKAARLYVKYSHKIKKQRKLLDHYFNYLLNRMGFKNKNELFQKTLTIYNKQHNNH